MGGSSVSCARKQSLNSKRKSSNYAFLGGIKQSKTHTHTFIAGATPPEHSKSIRQTLAARKVGIHLAYSSGAGTIREHRHNRATIQPSVAYKQAKNETLNSKKIRVYNNTIAVPRVLRGRAFGAVQNCARCVAPASTTPRARARGT